MVDLNEHPVLLEQVKAAFKERKDDAEYKAILPEGQAPIKVAREKLE